MITHEDIVTANERLEGLIHRTTLDPSHTFSNMSNAEVYLKTENLQKTGSFKIRGAYNFMSCLPEAERSNGVVAASAGNHAQGVAYAAGMAEIPAVIVMPEGTPISKIAATRSYGAEVVLHGTVFDDSYDRAKEIAEENNATFVHAFNNPQVIAGQGTIGLEILEELPEVDVIVAPIGGGGLISGISAAVKTQNPGVRIIGVEAAGAASVKNSLQVGEISSLQSTRTIADGISIKRPGDLTFSLIKQYVDEVVTVDDKEIAATVMLLLQRAKLVTEPAGAASLAALLHSKIDVIPDDKTVAVLSGGNIDMNFISRIIDKGLAKTGIRVKLTTTISDSPGNLKQLLSIVAGQKANVISIRHDRLDPEVPLDEVQVNMVIETRGPEHIHSLTDSLKQAGYRVRVD